jgi:hypothetical protein
MWAVVVFLLANPADVRAEPSGTAATKPPAPAAKKRQQDPAKNARPDAKIPPADAAKSGPKMKRYPKGKEPETPGVSPAARTLAKRTRGVFMFAVESCGATPQSRCDTALRDDAEKRFMDACGACTTFDRCETDRKAIRDGTAASYVDPCVP